ncbi:MAG: alpha/beta hydrolase [Acutalibacteraceae bacterium]|nr:alpha/beta hydrolase [Acutalibacteraceae bacterium]
MIVEKIHLKEIFTDVLPDDTDPVVEMYLQTNMSEIGKENQKRPAMIICPGGAYMQCSRLEAEPIALNFLSEGYNTFIINYSVVNHSFPTQLIEIAALIELIYSKQDEWNIDTDKLVIIGFSAGGHLASHYTNSFDCDEVRKVFPESKGVNACVLCYPVISAEERFIHKVSFERVSGKKELTDEDINKFSTDRLVSEKTPPTFLWHTTEDNSVPVGNSLIYASALEKCKIPFELHIYPYGRHGLSTCDAQVLPQGESSMECNIYNHRWLEEVKRWLQLIGFTSK